MRLEAVGEQQDCGRLAVDDGARASHRLSGLNFNGSRSVRLPPFQSQQKF
jgi:hypothetical protein